MDRRIKWAEGKEPGVVHNQASEYAVPQDARELYEKELQRWIDDEWLLPYDEQTYGPDKGLIPLMAVMQRDKRKVRPVMGFRELNMHIDAFTANSDMCADNLRVWRGKGKNVSVVD